jgi:cytochrome c oxidase subunit 3
MAMTPAEILERAPAVPGPGGPSGPAPPRTDGHDGGRPERSPQEVARFGIWLMLGTMSMMFIGFTSSYIVRRGAGDWQPMPLPPLLWVNTLALLASSVALEAARRALMGWNLAAARRWLGLTGLLGLAFAAGQFGAWRQLASLGVFLSSHPHSSFFYMLTGVHLVHLAGGLVWFGAAFSRLRRMAWAPGEDGLGLFAIYWHFLGALWAYLLLLLYVL